MSTPAFVALRRRFPLARITLVTLHSQSADQAAKVRSYAGGDRAAPWIDLIRPHTLDDVHVLPPVRGLKDLIVARRIMAEVTPDLVVQMFDPGTPYIRRAKKIAFILLLCGFVRQIGWRHRGQIRDRHPPAIDPHLGHHVLGPLSFIRELDGKTAAQQVEFDIRPGADAQHWARNWISQRGLERHRLVAIAPGAIHDHKQWPVEKFAALVQMLSDTDPDLRFVVVGTGKDSALAATLVAAAEGCVHDLCGKSSITQSAALFSHCALVVGNDGGAMHLADAAGAAVVSIVPGLEFPDSIEPWHNRDRAVRHPVPCAPCYSFTFCPEGHRRCMVDLPLSAVFAQCERALGGAIAPSLASERS